MELTIQPLKPIEVNDFKKLIRVFEKSFEMENFHMPDTSDLINTLNQSSFVAIVIKDENNDVLGGLTGYTMLQYYENRPLMYIYDIGVKPALQNQRLGKKLITWLIEYCKERNYAEIFVEAEQDDLQACGFYRSTRISGELAVSHFYYTL